MAVTYGSGGKIILCSEAADAVTGLLKIRDINWIKPTNSGDDLVITTTGGKAICSMTGLENSDQKREIRQWVDGIIIGTLDSGSVEVVLE